MLPITPTLARVLPLQLGYLRMYRALLHIDCERLVEVEEMLGQSGGGYPLFSSSSSLHLVGEGTPCIDTIHNVCLTSTCCARGPASEVAGAVTEMKRPVDRVRSGCAKELVPRC
jgi:hypothetical protein